MFKYVENGQFYLVLFTLFVFVFVCAVRILPEVNT